MRAKEFILETNKKDYSGKFQSDVHASMPNGHIYPDLDNSSGYLAYRFGLAVAGMPDKKMDIAGPTGLKMVTIGYTQAEEDILDAAANLVGTPRVRLSTNGSQETKDVYKTSPVADWNPRNNSKKNES